MAVEKGVALLRRLLEILLARMAAFWGGPGAAELRRYAARGQPSIGLEEMLSSWRAFALEGIEDDVDITARTLYEEAPKKTGKAPPRGAKMVVFAEGRFSAIFPNRFAEDIVALITEITDEQRRTIVELLTTGLAGIDSIDDTARQLKEVVGLHSRQIAALRRAKERLMQRGIFGEALEKKLERLKKRALRYRAWNIARTSYNRIMQMETIEAARMLARKLGHLEGYKKWMVTPDERLCDLCAPMDSLTVPLDGEFTLPTGKTVKIPAESHPQCRCAVVTIHKLKVKPDSQFSPYSRHAAERRFEHYLTQLPEQARQPVKEAVENALAYVDKHVGVGLDRIRATAWELLETAPLGKNMLQYDFAAALDKALGVELRPEKPIGDIGAKVSKSLVDWLKSRTYGAIAPEVRNQYGVKLPQDPLKMVAFADLPGRITVKHIEGRAYACPDAGELYLPKECPASTLAHELMHLVEQARTAHGQDVLRLSIALRDLIKTSERVVSLKEVLSEVCDVTEDAYQVLYHPYMGKMYPYDKATEVLSFIAESVFSPYSAPFVVAEPAFLAHLIFALRLW